MYPNVPREVVVMISGSAFSGSGMYTGTKTLA